MRAIYFYHSRRAPVFLLAAFGKGERCDLSRDEIHALAKAVKLIGTNYGEG